MISLFHSEWYWERPCIPSDYNWPVRATSSPSSSEFLVCETLIKKVHWLITTIASPSWVLKSENFRESIIILGLVVGRLADAVELGVLLALLRACRQDHLLLLGLG